MADIRSFFSSTARPSASSSSPTESSSVPNASMGEGEGMPPTAKRSRHRESGFDPQWPVDFPWVQQNPEGSGLFCKLCRKHSRRPKKVAIGRAAWVDIPCQTLTRQSLRKHASSDSHKDAVTLETQLCLSTRDGGISAALSTVQSAERRAMIGAMKCMYWLCMQEIPHTTNFSSLLELAKSLGATYLYDLCLGRNALYISERFMQEAVSCLGEVISSSIYDEITLLEIGCYSTHLELAVC